MSGVRPGGGVRRLTAADVARYLEGEASVRMDEAESLVGEGRDAIRVVSLVSEAVDLRRAASRLLKGLHKSPENPEGT